MQRCWSYLINLIYYYQRLKLSYKSSLLIPKIETFKLLLVGGDQLGDLNSFENLRQDSNILPLAIGDWISHCAFNLMCSYPAAEPSNYFHSWEFSLLTRHFLIFNKQIFNCEQSDTYNAVMQPLFFFFFSHTQNISSAGPSLTVPALCISNGTDNLT